MSPIPSPTPLRRTIARIVFSPTGLLFAFVVLVIAACPGARADDGLRSLAATDPMLALARKGMNLDSDVFVPLAKPRSTAPLGRSGRRESLTPTKARSATPAERGEPATKVSSVDLRPMVGPPVGIRVRLPHERL